MKQTALLIATMAVTLAFAGASAQAGGPAAAHTAVAQHPQRGVNHGMRGDGGRGHDGRGHDGRGLDGPGQFGGVGMPLAIPLPQPEVVTHDFVDPRDFAPPPYFPRRMPRSATILEERPVVYREPPQIIERGRRKHRPPIFVVRRGLISEE